MKIAVLGCGTVGSGVVDILDNKPCLMEKSAGEEIGVKYILDIRDFSGSPYASRIVNNIDIIAEDPEIGVVVETMGGVEPAFTFCKKCLEKGKSVVSSNKALVAAKAQELFAAALFLRRDQALSFRARELSCGRRFGFSCRGQCDEPPFLPESVWQSGHKRFRSDTDGFWGADNGSGCLSAIQLRVGTA